jgi:hypothetical protein
MTEKTFAELYCEKRGISAEDYAKLLFKETLYPHCRPFVWLIRMVWPRHFAADVEFVNSVARLRRFREFYYESEEFAHHPENRGLWRITLNFRISSRQMRHLVRTTLYPDAQASSLEDHTAVPFGGVEAPAKRTVKTPRHTVAAQ